MNDILDNMIARLEQAHGTDYSLSQDIGRLLDTPQRYEHPGSENPAWPNYTYSIDAALALVPEGARWEVGWDGSEDQPSGKCCGYAAVNSARIVEGATPAIALCIACLKAFKTRRHGARPFTCPAGSPASPSPSPRRGSSGCRRSARRMRRRRDGRNWLGSQGDDRSPEHHLRAHDAGTVAHLSERRAPGRSRRNGLRKRLRDLHAWSEKP